MSFKQHAIHRQPEHDQTILNICVNPRLALLHDLITPVDLSLSVWSIILSRSRRMVRKSLPSVQSKLTLVTELTILDKYVFPYYLRMTYLQLQRLTRDLGGS